MPDTDMLSWNIYIGSKKITVRLTDGLHTKKKYK